MPLISSAFTADPPEVDGRVNIRETHVAADGQEYSYSYLCDLAQTDPQLVLEERILVIDRVLAARAAARLLVQGTLVPMTRFEFLDRFTPQERIAVRERAKTDPMVYDFMDLLYQSGNVTHAKARQGLAYLGSIGVLPADRVASIGAE